MGSITGIQLNCQSLNNKLFDVKLMIHVLKPDFVALSETWISRHIPKFYNYQAEWLHRTDRLGGGLGMLIRRGIQYQYHNLNHFSGGVLEYQAIKLHLQDQSSLIVFSIYNPNKNVTLDEIEFYINQLGNKYLIIGDFNAHTPMLTSKSVRRDITGRTVEQMIADTDCCLVTPYDFFTRLDVAHLSRACLDLCFASTSIVSQCSVELLRDVGSDHLPVRINIIIEPKCNDCKTRKRWITNDRSLCNFSQDIVPSSLVRPSGTQETLNDFTDRLLTSAKKNLKSTSGRLTKKKKAPWWDSDCYRAIYQRRKARKLLERSPTMENANLYKEKHQLASETTKKKKDDSFQNFISSINMDTPSSIVWRRIKGLSPQTFTSIPPLMDGSNLLLDNNLKANLIAETFARNSIREWESSPSIDESISTAISQGSEEPYNRDFELFELYAALESLRKKSSPGEDTITYTMIKAFSQETLKELLSIYNQIFSLGDYPSQWKEGLIMPILKPGKPPDNPNSYRPVTMLSCVGKVFERLIKNRLEYIVESKSVLDSSQSGFRAGQGTIDVLLKLENLIRDSLSNKKICLVTYIDLKSAFDCVWGKGVTYKLTQKGIKGNMINILQSYFQPRGVKLWLEGEMSNRFELNAGTPQGGVLSPLLFNVMLSDVPRRDRIHVLIYADDITVVCSGDNSSEVRSLMESYLKEFVKWTKSWGVIINVNKTFMQHFTKKRISCPVVRMQNRVLEYKKEQTILGMIFDSPSLTWKAHIKNLKYNCLRRIDLMKVISSTKFGIPARMLRTFYIAYIRSKLAYGSILYASAAKSYLTQLDVIQNSCMRLILGARKTSPILSLQAESYLPPLEKYRNYLSVKQYIKLKHKQSGYSTTLDLRLDLRESPSSVKSFKYRVEKSLNEINFPKIKHSPIELLSPVPPWESISQFVIFGSTITDNQSFLHYLHTYWRDFETIYTDGSKLSHPNESSVACAQYCPSDKSLTCWKLNDEHSIVAAELFALYKALSALNGTQRKVIIFTDSKSGLQLIVNKSPKTYENLIYKIQSLLKIKNQNNTIVLHWVKAHCGILGNEIADRGANQAHRNNRSELLQLPKEYFYNLYNRYFRENWNQYWRSSITLTSKGQYLLNFRQAISNKLLIYAPFTRREQVILTRLRIGHAAVQSYKQRFKISDDPNCEWCSVPETIDHYFLECTRYNTQREVFKKSFLDKGIPFTIETILGGCRGDFSVCRSTIYYINETERMNTL